MTSDIIPYFHSEFIQASSRVHPGFISIFTKKTYSVRRRCGGLQRSTTFIKVQQNLNKQELAEIVWSE